jgi:hypothetical protein
MGLTHSTTVETVAFAVPAAADTVNSATAATESVRDGRGAIVLTTGTLPSSLSAGIVMAGVIDCSLGNVDARSTASDWICRAGGVTGWSDVREGAGFPDAGEVRVLTDDRTSPRSGSCPDEESAIADDAEMASQEVAAAAARRNGRSTLHAGRELPTRDT